MRAVALAGRDAAAGPTVAEGRAQPPGDGLRLRDVFGADKLAQVAARQVPHFGCDEAALAVHLRLAHAAVGRGGLTGAARVFPRSVAG